MRKLLPAMVLIGSLALFGQGCVNKTPVARAPAPTPMPVPAPVPVSANFGETATIQIGRAVSFPDGLTITLEKIDDSRCPKDVQCIWAGELAPTFKIEGGDIKEAQQLRLGTVLAPDHVLGMYKLVLKSADTASVSIIVTKTDASAPKPTK